MKLLDLFKKPPVPEQWEGFKRLRLPDIEYPVGDWRWKGTNRLTQYAYWCPKCDTRLTDGPRGGMSVNAVCEKCRINYGELPGFWGDQDK